MSLFWELFSACLAAVAVLMAPLLVMHIQNRKALNAKFNSILVEYRPHTHTERSGPLMADGILFPRGLNGR